MKKQTIFPIIPCLLMFCILGSCKSKFDEKEYLTKILNNIEQIKSASYLTTKSSTMMGDTSTFRTPYNWYVKEFSNPADTALGVSFGLFYTTDTTKMYYSYDGNARASIDDDTKTISIDSFKIYRMPFRGVPPPFFNETKGVIQYALTSNDSLATEFHDFGDSLLFRLTIYSDRQVVLRYNRPVTLEAPEGFSVGNQIHEIWINKTTGLPYRYKNIMAHNVSWEEYSDLQLNKMDIKDFIQARYFPADYDIAVSGQKQTPVEVNLTGKTAPDWTLTDYNNESFALKDFKSKVLLVQFSGIGCPPCHASLPFINQLTAEYKDKSLELVRVECWSDNTDAMKRYCEINDIKYKFLIKNEEIEKQYNVLAVPIFFILDNNKVIQKVIRGYAPEITDKEIKEAIDKLL